MAFGCLHMLFCICLSDLRCGHVSNWHFRCPHDLSLFWICCFVCVCFFIIIIFLNLFLLQYYTLCSVASNVDWYCKLLVVIVT